MKTLSAFQRHCLTPSLAQWLDSLPTIQREHLLNAPSTSGLPVRESKVLSPSTPLLQICRPT